MRLTPQQVYRIAGETGLAPSTIRRALDPSGHAAAATYIAIATAAGKLGIALGAHPSLQALSGRAEPQS